MASPSKAAYSGRNCRKSTFILTVNCPVHPPIRGKENLLPHKPIGSAIGTGSLDFLIAYALLIVCHSLFKIVVQNGFCVHTDAVTHMVYSDEKWICFILNQILLNSMKYRREQNPVIEICTQEADGHVLLSVRDNGIGIPAQELERVFDKGFTGSNGRGQKTGRSSTGIGLYLCGQLCSRLGIDIRIDSQEGLYTSVFLYFPKEEAFRKISG